MLNSKTLEAVLLKLLQRKRYLLSTISLNTVLEILANTVRQENEK